MTYQRNDGNRPVAWLFFTDHARFACTLTPLGDANRRPTPAAELPVVLSAVPTFLGACVSDELYQSLSDSDNSNQR